MTSFRKICTTAVLCGLSTSAFAGDASEARPVETAGNCAVSFSPQQVSVNVSDFCTLYVVTESVGDSIGCVECWVSFDTTCVSLVEAQEGELFTQAAFPRLFFSQPLAPDTHSVEGCLLGFQSYALSPGKLARYVFQATASGTCPVRITRMLILDIERDELAIDLDPNAWIVIGSPTGITEKAPAKGQLKSYPNPFNPSTTLVLSLPTGGERDTLSEVVVAVYGSDGRLVRVLFRGEMPSGERQLFWDGFNNEGKRVSSGVYFAVARTNRETYTTKLVLIE
jgi:hypothetical protein